MRLKVSALCITRDRPEFADWLAWNLNKQTRQADEVILVDSGQRKMVLEDFPRGMNRIYPDRGLVPSDARQVAQDAATGDVIIWYDDDDWYPAEKNELLVAPLEENPELLATEMYPAWWFDLRTGMMERQHARTPGKKVKRAGRIEYIVNTYQPVLPVFATRADVAKAHPWPVDVYQGSDTTWMKSVVADLRPEELLTIDHRPAIIILVHNKNVYQNDRPQKSYRFLAPDDLGLPNITTDEWRETLERLRKVKVL